MGLFKSSKDSTPQNIEEVEEASEKSPDAISHEEKDTGTEAITRNQIVDPGVEKRLISKLDWNVVPLVFALYLLSFLDRSNIGNARTAGMQEDLRLNHPADRYDWLLTAFYIAYIVFEWTTLCWKIVPPHIWASFVTFSWGLLATVQGAAQSWGGMMAIRFLLGAFEASYGPAVAFYLSFFYLRYEVGFRVGVFLSAAPLASTFAGALAYGITSGHPDLASWRLLFIVEGLPTVLMCPVAYYFLPDSPDKARFLSVKERELGKARGVKQAGEGERIGQLNFKDVGRTLLDAKAWFTALMYFSCNVSFSSLPVFLPTILKDMGFTAINAQGLSAPPYFLSFLLTCTAAYVADRTHQRAYTIMATSALGGAGYVVLAATTNVGARYFAVFLAAAGVFPSIACILPWVTNNQGSDTRRGAGIVLLNLVGQCGPLLGTRVYPTADAPRYVRGMGVCAAFMFFTTALAAGLRALLVWENRRLERKDEGRVGKDVDGAEGEGGAENYGPGFRYVL